MSEFDSLVSGGLPGEVLQTLEHFENAFGAVLVLTVRLAEPSEAERAVIYESKPGLGESESMGSVILYTPRAGACTYGAQRNCTTRLYTILNLG